MRSVADFLRVRRFVSTNPVVSLNPLRVLEMPTVVRGRVPGANAKVPSCPFVLKMVRRATSPWIAAAAFVRGALVRMRVRRVDRRAASTAIVVPENAAMGFAANWGVLRRVSCAFRMWIVARMLATRAAEFVAMRVVWAMACPVPKMAIVARAFFAIPPIAPAARFPAKSTAINAAPIPNVAAFFASTTRVNARQTAPYATKPKPTNAARAFVKMARASIVVLPERPAPMMANAAREVATTAFVVPVVALTTFA